MAISLNLNVSKWRGRERERERLGRVNLQTSSIYQRPHYFLLVICKYISDLFGILTLDVGKRTSYVGELVVGELTRWRNDRLPVPSRLAPKSTK